MIKKIFIFKLFINALMKEGKQCRAEDIFLTALSIIKKKKRINPYFVANRAIENVKPLFELKVTKIAAARYRIPYLLKPGRDYIFSARFILKNAKKRSEKTSALRLANELIDAAKRKGASIKQKRALYKEVVINRAFLRFRKT